MKYFKLLLIMMYISNLEANSCLSKTEKKDIIIQINDFQNNYGDVPNYIQCDKSKHDLEKLVCKNQDYLLMFHLLSIYNVYAWENAFKKEVNHKTWNKKNMSYWLKGYNSSPINLDKLCFDLKSHTKSLGGDGICPYISIELWGKTFFIQTSSEKLILTDQNDYKIYLNKTCKVSDSHNNQGYWYQEDNKY